MEFSSENSQKKTFASAEQLSFESLAEDGQRLGS